MSTISEGGAEERVRTAKESSNCRDQVNDLMFDRLRGGLLIIVIKLIRIR